MHAWSPVGRNTLSMIHRSVDMIASLGWKWRWSSPVDASREAMYTCNRTSPSMLPGAPSGTHTSAAGADSHTTATEKVHCPRRVFPRQQLPRWNNSISASPFSRLLARDATRRGAPFDPDRAAFCRPQISGKNVKSSPHRGLDVPRMMFVANHSLP